MNKISLLIAASVFGFGLYAPNAMAQSVNASVVVSCGTPNAAYPVGTARPVTQDPTGTLCTSSGGGGGGGGAITAAANSYATGFSSDIGTLVSPNPASLLGLLTSLNTVAAAPLAAGTNIIGKVGIDQTTPGTTNGVVVTAATTGGATSGTFEVAASDNHQTIKNGAGTVYSISGFSIHTAAMFLRLYDLGTGFNGCNSATGLIWEGNIPGPGTTGSGFVFSLGPTGRAFTTGLSVCVTGAFGNTNTTSATASVASVNIGYK